ncbi:MAG: right-handed parallel beta-helix repeat-containing protein [Alphaproteobacteria bacterium]|nr:right-handed parallel beta-helix repeat-containing protein [Alphaproteobacteria bacterium]
MKPMLMLLAALLLPGLAEARTIRVGPQGDVELPSEAARIAKDGDVIEIAAQDFVGDVAVWRADRLTIRGTGGRPRLEAGGQAAEGKAIWVIKGDGVTVENIAFAGAKVRDKNGAGIRAQGRDLTVRDCLFDGNQNGILAHDNAGSVILVERSEFKDSGAGDGHSHGIYVNKVERLVFRHNWVHGTRIGHHVKTRARENLILHNRLEDGPDGAASYAVDMPNGHLGVVVGNVMHKGPNAENRAVVNFIAPVARPGAALHLINNTVVGERRGVLLANRSPIEADLRNNLIIGALELVDGRGGGGGNLTAQPSDLGREYALRGGAAAIDSGVAIEVDSLRPKSEYVHPLGARPRVTKGPLDVGAFECP